VNFVVQLNVQLTERDRRITDLSLRQLSDEDAAKLKSRDTTSQQLKSSQSAVLELESKLKRTEDRWAQSLGNEKAALAAVDELITKFNKRWAEATGHEHCDEVVDCSETDINNLDDKICAPQPDESVDVQQMKQIAILRHKLDQALENVRQSETARENLATALSMNGELSAKLEELKAKYSALQSQQPAQSRGVSATSSSGNQAGHGSAHNSGSHNNSTDAVSSRDKDVLDSRAGEGGSSDRPAKYEKAYRKTKDELKRVVASRESVKTKLEKAQKDLDGIMETNVKLMKQIGEKDEMNAKSLSTILHLKSLTEKLASERDNLEHQAKSASQLALAARLATNAKERVSEEILKEKGVLEERIADLETQYQSTVGELERVSTEWSEASGKMAVKDTELTNALKRSEELAADNEHKREEIRKLVDVVTTAERDAKEAKEKFAEAMKSGMGPSAGVGSSGLSSYSVDQLKTQISVLKSRLACPVCHYRDKECIILRCRHMHCKQCVDERISNRSRKCPTCNVKFSENDVGDIWLNC
jgi:E3 ubiquitin-protein ligase BRE1